jgi:hypothetical protein
MCVLAKNAVATEIYVRADSLLSAGDTLFVSLPGQEDLDFIAMETRCAMPSADIRRHRHVWWSMLWDDVGGECGVTVDFDMGEMLEGVDAPAAIVSLWRGGEMLSSAVVSSGFDFSGRWNSVSVEWSAGRMNVYVGDRLLAGCLSVEMPQPRCRRFGVTASDKVHVDEMMAETEPDPYVMLQTEWTAEKIVAEFDRPDGIWPGSLEGQWVYLDRDTDTDKALPGGEYRLAIVRSGSGYDILYMEGARTCASEWKCGMLKGRLMPTAFDGHFLLEWYDAEGYPAGRENYATLENPSLLSMSFPLLDSMLRFSRCSRAGSSGRRISHDVIK